MISARISIVIGLILASVALAEGPAAPQKVSKVAFGSCASQLVPQVIWPAVLDSKPDLFVFLGDNIYCDTEDSAVRKKEYAKLAAQPGFAKLRQSTPILATWDDHDYGFNDGGAEFRGKVQSQRDFLDFWGDAADSVRRQREGVYDAKVFGPPGQRVQIILLDLRYFRSPLTLRDPTVYSAGPYVPSKDPRQTMLGAAQWKWLEEQLRQPAEVRILCSSIQLVADTQPWERWANLPLERERLYKLIAETQASGVIVISGDRHRAEISKATDAPLPYPLYDITSSGLTNGSEPETQDEPNERRVGRHNYIDINYGIVEVDWSRKEPVVSLRIHDKTGKPVLSHDVPLSELRVR